MTNENTLFILLSFSIGLVSFVFTTMLIKRIIKQDSCLHKNSFMYVENTAATCEKVTTTCLDCGHKSTKIEC